MTEDRGCGGDAAAYVLGALDSFEAGEFRRHLHSCVVCRDEIAVFGHVLDALPMAALQYPVPRRLRRRVTRAVRAEPRSARPTRRSRLGERSSRSLVPRPALAGGLLAALALVTVGAAVLAAGGSSGVRVIQAGVTGVPASAQLRIAGAHAELIVSHLPPPAAGRIYELWIKRGHHPPSPTRALFSVSVSGAAQVGVPGDVRGVSTVMVTQEPSGGSVVPTGPAVILARLS